MLPTAHLAVTYIVWWFAHRFFGADTNSLYLGIVFGVLIDIDALLLGSKHRASPLHSYLMWIILIIALYFVCPKYFWVPLFSIIHLLLDTIDYEVYIAFPLIKRTFGLGLAKSDNLIPGKNSLFEFALHYLHKPVLFVLELFFGITALGLFTISLLSPV